MEDAIQKENVNVLNKTILEVTANITLNRSQNVLKKELTIMLISLVFVNKDLRESFVNKSIALITVVQEDLVLKINVYVLMDFKVLFFLFMKDLIFFYLIRS